MTDAWSKWERDAVQTGGEFPEIPDDMYDAVIREVSDPVESNLYEGQWRFFLTWELQSGDVPGGTTLRQYLSLPASYQESGYLSPKANLHKVMTGLGFDMSNPYEVKPKKWVGMEARVYVENSAPESGGPSRPQVTKVTTPRKKQPQPAAPKRRAAEWADD